MSLAPPIRRRGEYIPPSYGGCGCICHRMAGVKHCVPCCYPSVKEAMKTYEEIDLENLQDLIEQSKMDPKHDHLNALLDITEHALYNCPCFNPTCKGKITYPQYLDLLENSDRPDAGKPRC